LLFGVVAIYHPLIIHKHPNTNCDDFVDDENGRLGGRGKAFDNGHPC
jgi:hypothetical protein